jgi:hypothetical protein
MKIRWFHFREVGTLMLSYISFTLILRFGAIFALEPAFAFPAFGKYPVAEAPASSFRR